MVGTRAAAAVAGGLRVPQSNRAHAETALSLIQPLRLSAAVGAAYLVPSGDRGQLLEAATALGADEFIKRHINTPPTYQTYYTRFETIFQDRVAKPVLIRTGKGRIFQKNREMYTVRVCCKGLSAMHRSVKTGAGRQEYELVQTTRRDVAFRVLPGGKLRVYAPRSLPLREADRLVAANWAQIEQALRQMKRYEDERDAKYDMKDGMNFPLEGCTVTLRVRQAPKKTCEFAGG